jgi:osmotically-inducible protein OsmY
MKSDRELEAEIAGALFTDLRVDDEEIAVSVADRAATLRGTVGSIGAKLSAEQAARRVRGVRHVENALQVRLLTKQGREDAELRGSVLRALSWDSTVPGGVDATVDNGIATLTGTVDSRRQLDEAEAAIRNLRGVLGIDNQLALAQRLP